MQVHRVVSSDWEALRALRLRALLDAPSAFASTYERESAWPAEEWQAWALASEIGDRQATFAALDGSSWTGMVFAVLGEDGVTADLFGMWVNPTYRRRGAGRALVDAIANWARAKVRQKVRLDVAEGNQAASDLYEAIGFRATGTCRPLPSNPAVLEVEMELPLTPEHPTG